MSSNYGLSPLRASRRAFRLATVVGIVVIAGCGDDGPAPTYTVGGSISGLTESGLTLTNNGGAPLSVPANATSFTFPGTLANAAVYKVAVANQPDNPPLSCTVSDGSSTVGQANVTSVHVTCVPFQVVGGGVANLLGSGLSLSVNGGAPLAISQSGPFTFPTQLRQGAAYRVTIVQQPTNPGQACVLVNGSGTVPTSNVSSIALYCPRPAGRFAYVTNPGPCAKNILGQILCQAGSVSLYKVDASTGALTAVGASVTAEGHSPGPLSLSTSPSTLYVGNGEWVGHPAPWGSAAGPIPNPPTISAYALDAATGGLTAGNSYSFSIFGSCGSCPPVFAVAPSGRFGYVTDSGAGNIVTFSLNPQNGDLTLVPPLPPSGENTSPLIIGPSGTFAANVTDNQGLTTYQLNTQTGAVNPAASIQSPGSYVALAIEPTGRFLYAATKNEIVVFAINSATGAITPVSGGGLSTGESWTPGELQVSPTGALLYALLSNQANSTSEVNVYAIDPGTGLLTATSAPALAAASTNTITMAFDPSATYVYVNDGQGQVLGYSIDTETGALVALPSNPQPVGTNPLAVIVAP
jgi:6-phosphogluconolactonase